MLIQNKVMLEYGIPTSSTIPTLTSVAVLCPSPTCINKTTTRKSRLIKRSCSLFIFFLQILPRKNETWLVYIWYDLLLQTEMV